MLGMDVFELETNEFFNQAFQGLELVGEDLSGKVFEECSFRGCDFSEADLSKARFIDCYFSKCNLSLIKVVLARFSNVSFESCKLVGVDWTRAAWPDLALAAPFAFQQCILNDSSFFGLKLRELVLEACKAHDVDFREAELAEANFSHSDLSNSLFGRTDLSGANFEEAVNYRIDILNNRLKGARFTRSEALGLLAGLDIELLD